MMKHHNRRIIFGLGLVLETRVVTKLQLKDKKREKEARKRGKVGTQKGQKRRQRGGKEGTN